MKKALLSLVAVLLLASCGETQQPVASVPPEQESKAPVQIPATLIDAIKIARPHMTDVNGTDVDIGSGALAIWGADHMTWSELQELPLAKYALVMKDSDSQRGNRICISGRVIEIIVDNSVPGKKLYRGGLFDEGMRIYRFIAVKSTGDIVGDSRARFCGVVTGQQHYQNSMGGVAHAVHLVGMFDLPENKQPKK